MNDSEKQTMKSFVKYIYFNISWLLKGALCLLCSGLFIKKDKQPLSVLNTFWISFAIVADE